MGEEAKLTITVNEESTGGYGLAAPDPTSPAAFVDRDRRKAAQDEIMRETERKAEAERSARVKRESSEAININATDDPQERRQALSGLLSDFAEMIRGKGQGSGAFVDNALSHSNRGAYDSPPREANGLAKGIADALKRSAASSASSIGTTFGMQIGNATGSPTLGALGAGMSSSLAQSAMSGGKLGAGLGVAAVAVSAFTEAVQAGREAMLSLAEGATKYNAEAASAQANRSFRQIENEMKQSDRLGPLLAEYIDSQSRLETALMGIKTEFAATFGKSLVKINDTLTYTAETAQGFTMELGNVGSAVGKEFGQVFEAIGFTKERVEGLWKWIESWNTFQEKAQRANDDGVGSLEKALEKFLDPNNNPLAAELVPLLRRPARLAPRAGGNNNQPLP